MHLQNKNSMLNEKIRHMESGRHASEMALKALQREYGISGNRVQLEKVKAGLRPVRSKLGVSGYGTGTDEKWSE